LRVKKKLRVKKELRVKKNKHSGVDPLYNLASIS
jgi:hypothetical protein